MEELVGINKLFPYVLSELESSVVVRAKKNIALKDDIRFGPLFETDQGQRKRVSTPYRNSPGKSYAGNTLPRLITQ